MKAGDEDSSTQGEVVCIKHWMICTRSCSAFREGTPRLPKVSKRDG
jgi:hypothetical protein